MKFIYFFSYFFMARIILLVKMNKCWECIILLNSPPSNKSKSIDSRISEEHFAWHVVHFLGSRKTSGRYLPYARSDTVNKRQKVNINIFHQIKIHSKLYFVWFFFLCVHVLENATKLSPDLVYTTCTPSSILTSHPVFPKPGLISCLKYKQWQASSHYPNLRVTRGHALNMSVCQGNMYRN